MRTKKIRIKNEQTIEVIDTEESPDVNVKIMGGGVILLLLCLGVLLLSVTIMIGSQYCAKESCFLSKTDESVIDNININITFEDKSFESDIIQDVYINQEFNNVYEYGE